MYTLNGVHIRVFFNTDSLNKRATHFKAQNLSDYLVLFLCYTGYQTVYTCIVKGYQAKTGD